MLPKFNFQRLIGVLALSALAACGGGGNDTGITATVTTKPTTLPEGIWTGFTSSGWSYALAVLETGETWGIYHDSGTVFGAVLGTTATTTSTTSTTNTPVTTNFTGKGTEFFLPARAVVASTYSGSYTAKGTMRYQSAGGVVANATYTPLYDNPAITGVLAGTFNGQSVTATAPLVNQPLVISSTGAITGGTADCGITGVIMPRAPGKGVYSIYVNLQGDKCPESAVGAMQGVAIYDTSTRRLVAVTVNDKTKTTDGWFYVGTR